MRKLVERALPPGTEHLRESFLAAYQADYAEHLLDATRLFPGIPEVLDGLRSAGVPVGVLSNKPDLPTRRMVDALCGRWKFGAVVRGASGRSPQAGPDLGARPGGCPRRPPGDGRLRR